MEVPCKELADALGLDTEMEQTRARGEVANGPPPARLQGLLSAPGSSILDEPLEAGLDRPPEETIIPKEEAVDYRAEAAAPAAAAAAAATGKPAFAAPAVGATKVPDGKAAFKPAKALVDEQRRGLIA